MEKGLKVVPEELSNEELWKWNRNAYLKRKEKKKNKKEKNLQANSQ
jgi:hypothetical protein